MPNLRTNLSLFILFYFNYIKHILENQIYQRQFNRNRKSR